MCGPDFVRCSVQLWDVGVSGSQLRTGFGGLDCSVKSRGSGRGSESQDRA